MRKTDGTQCGSSAFYSRMLYALPKIMKYLENLDNLFLLCLFGIIICFFYFTFAENIFVISW